MTQKCIDLAGEVRILELGVKKLELENRITELKAEQSIDEECVGCCKVVDVAAKLQEELDECNERCTLLGSHNMQITANLLDRKAIIEDYKETIRVERIDRAAEKKMINRKFCGDLRKLHATIDELKDKNIEDLHELYDLYEKELYGLKNIISARDLTIKSLTTMCQSSGTERSKQNQALLHIKAELDAAKQFNPFDLVLISGSMENITNIIEDGLDAPEGPPETPIDEKTCVFCGRKNPSLICGADWYCDMRCVDGQADVNKRDEPLEITITVGWLELP